MTNSYNDFKRYVRSHNLVNRIYDMLYYFKVIKKDNQSEKQVKKFFNQRLEDVTYVETLAKYFESKLRKNKKNHEVRCNLLDLINDLNYLKQYLCDD